MDDDAQRRDVLADRLRVVSEDVPELVGWFRSAAQRRGVPTNRLAREVGVDPRTLERVLSGYNTRYVYWSTLVALARWLERQVRDGWSPPR